MVKTSWFVTWVAVSFSGTVLSAETPYPLSIPVPTGSPAPIYRQLEVSARDGTKLVVHEWAPPKAPADKPVVLFVHGIGMHGEPYGAVAAGFTSHNLTFMVPDLRGHGRSQGERGELAEPHVLRADLGAVIGLVHQRHPGAPIVLVGDSMGGLLAADYAWRGERRLAGLALLVPAFGVHPSQIRLAALGNLFQERVSLDEKLEASTRDRGFIKARRADKLAVHEVKPSYLLTIAGLQREWPRPAAEIKVPLFVGVAGKDQIINNAVAKQVYELAGTPKEEKTWRKWDEAYHTVCWDPMTPQVVEELARWVLKRSR